MKNAMILFTLLYPMTLHALSDWPFVVEYGPFESADGSEEVADSGENEDAEMLPGYIEVYSRTTDGKVVKANCYIFAYEETNLTSLGSLLRRLDEAYEKIWKDSVSFEEKKPGKGTWGVMNIDYKELMGVRNLEHKILYNVDHDNTAATNRDIFPIYWSAKSENGKHISNSSGEAIPHFLFNYRKMEEVAKKILRTEDVVCTTIYLAPYVTVFEGNGHTVYINPFEYSSYNIDEAINEWVPGVHYEIKQKKRL